MATTTTPLSAQVSSSAALRASSRSVVAVTTVSVPQFRRRLSISCAASPDTLGKVSTIIAKQLAVDPGTVTAESKFVDLGADSLDTVEIMMALEDEFKITLDEEGAAKISTVQEAADVIEDLVKANA